jgi:hypothetical protein
MKCCASPTICNVDSATLARVRTTMEALLFEQMLEPLARGNDLMGNYEVTAFAQTLAERLNDCER